MRMKTQRILAAMLSLVLLLALAPAGWADGEGGGNSGGGNSTLVSAPIPATGVDLTPGINQVEINLVPSDKAENEPDYATNIVNAKIQADLYLVAPAVKDDNYDTYHYEFVDYAPIRMIHAKVFEENLADDPDPAKQNNLETMLGKFTPLAHSFAEALLSDDNIIVPVSSEPTDRATSITVKDLDPGLYMLILRGSELKMKSDNEDECYVTKMTKQDAAGNPVDEFIATRAFSDDYEFIFEPQMITVPTRVDDSGAQQYNTAYGTKWSNVLKIVAKPDWKPRFGDLKITKTLNGFFGTKPALFIFDVEAKQNNKTVFSDTITLKFSQDGTKSATLVKKIPVGATVTVEEVYSSSYKQSGSVVYTLNGAAIGEGEQPTVAIDKMLAAVFVNEPGENPPGGGIVNHITYHPEEVADWGLTNPTDNADS